jgi:MFS family permease
MLLTFAIVSFIAGPAYNRLGPKLSVGIGALGLTVGPILLSFIGTDPSYGSLVAGLTAIGIGAGFFYASVTTAGVTALDPSRSSLAGGLIYMFQIAGGAIGLGITTTIFTISSENKLDSNITAAGLHASDQQVSVMHGVLAGTDAGTAAFDKLPTAAQHKVHDFVSDSFVHGIQSGFRFVSIAAILGLLVTIFFVGGRRVPGGSRVAEEPAGS